MTLDLGITRRQRYVSTATAANVTSSTYAQGGTITSYTYSGTTYIAHIFTVTGFFTVTSTINNLEFLAVAGGGGGGQSSNGSAGGGGGGGIASGSSLVTINRAYASSAFLAVTTSTQANVVGGWVDGPGQTDFTGGNGSFLYRWGAVQQTNGGARTMPLMDAGAYNNLSPQNYYMEIGITSINPANVGIGLIRDGAPLSGWNNVPYINLSTGVVAGFQGVSNVTLGAFQTGDTLQILWDSRYMVTGGGTYWWVGRNNTWNSTPISDTTNAGISTGTYKIGALRLIFMCTASGGGTMRGQFRSGLENKFAPPANNTVLGFTFTNYTGYYTNPIGTGYITTGNTFGVTIGAGGGVGSFNPTTSAASNGNNGGDTIIYNATNASSYYSAHFANGIITATNSAFSFGTNDFSIETWMYPTSSYGRNITYNYRPIFDSRDFNNRGGDVPNRGFVVYLGLYNNVGIYTSGTTYLTTVNTVTNAAWSHVAVTRVNGVMNVWINGIKDRTVFVTTSTAAFHNFTNTNIRIGYGSISQDWSISSFYTGYLSNYRIVNGVSAYNPGIFGLTAPLTATQNADVKGTPSVAISGTSTSLLMLTTSTTGILTDTSLGNTATLTNVGTVTAVGIGPGTYSGSLSFSGTGQYLTNAGSRAFTFGTDNFTVEYWVYYNATNGTFQHAVGNATSSVGYAFGIATNYLYITTVSVGYSALTAIIKIQQWLHIAFARSGTNINVYMNGSWVWTFSNMVDNITETGFSIGGRSNGTFLINGYLSNIRVVKGIALYTHTGNFTPPTTLTSSTQSAAIFYPGPANFPSVVAVNTITTQTVLLAFNTATIGNASTLTIALNQTSGTVTVSTFAPFTTSTEIVRAFGGGGGGGSFQQNGSSGGSGGGAASNGWGGTPVPGQGSAGGQGSQSLASGGGGYSTIGGPALNEGVWPVAGNPSGAGGAGGYFNHSGAMIAYSGGGGGGSWVNSNWTVGPGGAGGGGNGAYYAPVSGFLTSATSGLINSGGGGGGANNISAVNYNAAAGGSGIVIFRYPAFLGDAARFPTGLTDPYLKNTTLLLSGQYGQNAGTNNTIINSSYNNITINTATVTIAQGTFSPYGPLWSTSFNGSTDYLTFVSTGTRFALNSFFGLNKSFTIEAWINPNAVQLSNTATVILGDASPTGIGLAWSVGLDSSNKPMLYWNDAVGRNFITATNTLSTGTWNHVAWVSYAGTPTIFVNGIRLPTNASASTTLTNATQTLGIVIGAHWNRFYNGSISNLRVSTTTTYSIPTITSVYLNGSSYLTSATSTAMVFGTSNFTIEFWVYWFVSPGGTPQYVVGKAATPNGLVVGGYNGNWYMSTSNVGYTTNVAFNLNQWYHVAVVRNSGSMTLYVDGISRYITAFATSITETGVNVGTYLGTVNSTPNAVVSNIRILNGTALYTGSPFTVPTPNLTNITNTTLLTFVTTSTFLDYSSSPTTFTIVGTPAFVGLLPPSISTSSFILPVTPFNTPANTILLTNNSNRFIDISTSSISITTGTITSIPRVQRQSPFTLGYPYTPLTIGNSVSLNGTSDYLSFIFTPPPAIEYLVVAGGGGGGSADNSDGGGGGGGAGGLLTAAGVGVTAGTPIIVTVGGGGTGRANNTALGGSNGTESVFGSITAIGGGGGGTFATPGGLGGSGGGAFGRASQLGGAGTAGPPRQGNDGSPSSGGALGGSNGWGGTGGGGAGAASATNTNANGTAGGAGAASSISGTSVTYAGGGGGGGGTGAGTGGAGGTGGGGAGGRSAVNAVAGTTNSGGGGGGGGVISSGANGGSGVVIIRYSDSFPAAAATVGSPTYTVSGGYRIYTFTSSGSITFDNVTPVPSLPLQLDSDFTIESWIYTTSTAAQCIFDLAGITGNSLRPNSFALNIGTAGVLFFSYSNTTSPNSIRGITPYTWNHIAVTRTSDFMSIWQNGSLTLSVTSSTNFSNGALIIGRNGPTAASYFSGYISDFRIVKGQVLYNSTFNPPVAPLKPINTSTSTSLLLNFNNVSIIDASMNQNITIINTATTASNIVKYNPKTMYFPGVSDYLTITPVSITSYALGTSDFTVEMWIYVLPFPGWTTTNLQPATIRSIFDMRTTNTANAGFDIFLSATGILNVSTFGTTYISGTTPITVNTWHHVALVRQSNTFTLYLNGFTEGIYSSATPNFINPITRIGFGAAGGGYFNGYIDEVRVTRGVARYTTATFLVSQKALPVK